MSTYETIGRLHGNGADGILSQVLGHLKDKTVTLTFDLERIENFGKLLIELQKMLIAVVGLSRMDEYLEGKEFTS